MFNIFLYKNVLYPNHASKFSIWCHRFLSSDFKQNILYKYIINTETQLLICLSYNFGGVEMHLFL